ncbi:MAG: GAF domain-containing protein [Planctomycetes bacterium]|nr:GAF domain-containing protein [Planctomycetota bacterium]
MSSERRVLHDRHRESGRDMGEPSSLVSAGKTRRTQSERGMRPSLEAGLADMFLSLMGPMTVEEALNTILKKAQRLVGFERAAIMLLDEHSGDLVRRAALGLTQAERLWVNAVGRGVTGLAAQTGRPVYVPDVTRSDVYIPVEKGVTSELAVPIIQGKRTIGVFDALSSRKDAFPQSAQNSLCEICQRTGLACISHRYGPKDGPAAAGRA